MPLDHYDVVITRILKAKALVIITNVYMQNKIRFVVNIHIISLFFLLCVDKKLSAVIKYNMLSNRFINFQIFNRITFSVAAFLLELFIKKNFVRVIWLVLL